jgi:hypothetical protein
MFAIDFMLLLPGYHQSLLTPKLSIWARRRTIFGLRPCKKQLQDDSKS